MGKQKTTTHKHCNAISIGTFNVRGLTSPKDLNILHQDRVRYKVDILCIQETMRGELYDDYVTHEHEGKHYKSHYILHPGKQQQSTGKSTNKFNTLFLCCDLALSTRFLGITEFMGDPIWSICRKRGSHLYWQELYHILFSSINGIPTIFLGVGTPIPCFCF